MNAQGDLDALCGVYAVINAVDCLIESKWPVGDSGKYCGEKVLFRRLLIELAKPKIHVEKDGKKKRRSLSKLIEALMDGTDKKQMKRMVDIGVKYANSILKKDGKAVKISSSDHFDIDPETKTKTIWKIVHDHFSERRKKRRCIAIIGLTFTGKDEAGHWTCVDNSTQSSFSIKDSGAIKKLTIEECTWVKGNPRPSQTVDKKPFWLFSVTSV